MKRISILKYFPEIGKQVQMNNCIFRQIIYKSYRIFYQIDSNNIYILSIFHHSRDISNLKLWFSKLKFNLCILDNVYFLYKIKKNVNNILEC